MLAPRRRAALFSLAATAGALVAMPELAAADLLAPGSTASDGAGSARTLYIIMAVLAVLIVIGVLGAIARALRSRSAGDDRDDVSAAPAAPARSRSASAPGSACSR